VPNSQQTDGLPESVPVVLPPPDKPDATAGITLQRVEQREATGQAPLPNGTAAGLPAAAVPSPFSSPFADDRRNRTASMDAQRGSGGTGGVTNSSGVVPNGGTSAQGSCASGGVQPGGRKSSSYNNLPSGVVEQPATCVQDLLHSVMM
jgi:hypothetical protein